MTHFIYEFTKYQTPTLTVFVYPAKFKNFRNATESDIKAIECAAACPSEKRVYNDSSSPNSQNKGTLSGYFKKLLGK
ncbi:MAG: hypothetical protein IKD40_05630 [Bacteroidaceae bacterium]|nr:hypothetical protein [Bacteroidaceae bacterium]